MTAQTQGAVVLHPDDDVAVLLHPVGVGDPVVTGGAGEGRTLHAGASLPLGHKIALRALAAGADVHKYGQVIGRLTAAVSPGDHVHVHNLTSLRATAELGSDHSGRNRCALSNLTSGNRDGLTGDGVGTRAAEP